MADKATATTNELIETCAKVADLKAKFYEGLLSAAKADEERLRIEASIRTARSIALNIRGLKS